jgi:hypothetical protein
MHCGVTTIRRRFSSHPSRIVLAPGTHLQSPFLHPFGLAPQIIVVDMYRAKAVVIALSCQASTSEAACAFDNEPVNVSYFWDSSCENGTLGCAADGVNIECRYCGAGDYVNITCPSSSTACQFDNEPVDVGYFWDTSCTEGDLGCAADGQNIKCRYCGAGDYANITCPSACRFDNEPADVGYFWDTSCTEGDLGCAADGVSIQCRFCGAGDYTSIACPSACRFDNEPVDVGYFWDASCEAGDLGCAADGVSIQCRYCGAGDYTSITCPPSSCHFENEPAVAYYWDNDCVVGGLGCWADGVHAQCRFCGDHPFIGVACPEGAVQPNSGGCAFDNEPGIDYYWEPGCDESVSFGCNADGKNARCRFCGDGEYVDCPSQVCSFANEPSVSYYWDTNCTDGGLGCNADGIHVQCRFCGTRPFQDVPCPGQAAAEEACTWPTNGEPSVSSFWDPTCELGDLGCWADGLHAACRFCGEGVFATVNCSRRLGAAAFFV